MHVVACIKAAFQASQERRDVAVGWGLANGLEKIWGR